MHWNDVPSATGYDIMVDGNIYDNGNSTSYKHAAIEPNSMHLYQIRAKRGYDDGEWSEVISLGSVGFNRFGYCCLQPPNKDCMG